MIYAFERACVSENEWASECARAFMRAYVFTSIFFNFFQTGTTVKTLDITIRAWNRDVRFDVANDEIYRFTCTTDTALPASTDVMNNFKYESYRVYIISMRSGYSPGVRVTKTYLPGC